MHVNSNAMASRTLIYAAMICLLIAIFVGATRGAPPVYLAVAFIGEVILVATAHLSFVIQNLATPQGEPRP